VTPVAPCVEAAAIYTSLVSSKAVTCARLKSYMCRSVSPGQMRRVRLLLVGKGALWDALRGKGA